MSGHVLTNVEMPSVIEDTCAGTFLGPFLGGVTEEFGPFEGCVGFSFLFVAVCEREMMMRMILCGEDVALM
jgi:hypothetical protein